MKWEYIKYTCRESLRQYSIEKSKEKKNKLAEFEAKFSTQSNLDILEKYNKYKSELDALYDYITAGVILRSKCNWYEHGEKSSKYFLTLEKRNKAKSHVRTLLTESGNECTEPSEIMTKVKGFYLNLYKPRSMKTEEDCLEYLHTLNIPQLSEAERVSCEGSLTKRECWEALISMKNGKSPGNDGLTEEFYVCFFNVIFNYLLNALKESFNMGQLSTSQHHAVITLIEKKERNKRQIKNWRPISLMNVDAKIASKALATRMKNVLSSIIKSDQTAFVAGRYIGESIRLISDILEYVDEKELSGILFSADFEKAFDSIEHPFIFGTLQSFGFGPEFIQWIRTFLKRVESCVLNNGHSTGYFLLERGTRQGDPVSAYF